MKRTTLVLSLLGGLLPLTPCQAQSELPTDFLDMDLEQLLNVKITTASRLEERLGLAPGTVVVLTRQQIRERGYLNLLEVMNDLPAFDVQQYTDDKFYNRIAVRGITGNNKFIILQNGRRISSPTGDPIVVSYNFPLYLVKQIEVVYGPASAVYGADAFTGVINLLTDAPGDNEKSALRAIRGQYDFDYTHALSNQRLSEDLAISFGLHTQHSDNPDHAKDYPELYPIGDLRTFSGQTYLTADQREGYWAETESHSAYLRVAVGERFVADYSRSLFSLPTSTQTLSSMVDYGRHATWETQIDAVNAEYSFTASTNLQGKLALGCSRYQAKPKTFSPISLSIMSMAITRPSANAAMARRSISSMSVTVSTAV